LKEVIPAPVGADVVGTLKNSVGSAAPETPSKDPLRPAVQYMQERKYRDAIGYLQSLIPRSGSPIPARMKWALSVAFLGDGRLDLAQEHLGTLETSEISLEEAYLLARALESRNETGEALRFFRGIKGCCRLSQAEDTLTVWIPAFVTGDQRVLSTFTS